MCFLIKTATMKNLTEKTKQKLSLLRDYLCKSSQCYAFPRRLVVETTAKCNLRCKMCLGALALKRPRRDMSLKTFSNIVSQSVGKVEFMSLQGYGEPLLNPNIFQMIKMAKKSGIRTGISTNATTLNVDSSVKLIQSGLDHLTFAFDGASKKTYENIRRGANFEKVVKNIKNFLKIKKRLKSNIFVVIQCIFMQETANEVVKFKKMWQLDGVDALRIRQITQGISQYDEKTREKFKNMQNVPCYWLWIEPAIFWDGTVVACCQDVNAGMALGNINKDNLLRIWNSAKAQQIRKLHKEGKRKKIKICKDCNMYQPSLPLAIGSSLFNVFTLNKMVPWFESFISFLRYR